MRGRGNHRERAFGSTGDRRSAVPFGAAALARVDRGAADRALVAIWRRCRVDFLRDAPARVAGGRRQRVAAAIRAAFVRLVGAVLAGQTDEWAVSRRSMTLETLARLGHHDDDSNAIAAE